VAWRYKDKAKAQAQSGIITWKQFREFCTEVDRIKRARLAAAQAAHDVAVAAPSRSEQRAHREYASTAALMRDHGQSKNSKRYSSADLSDTHIDRSRKRKSAEKRSAIAASLREFPHLSDREHARRTGVSDKTVASVRRAMEESAEILHTEKRADPRTGRLSQASRRDRSGGTHASSRAACQHFATNIAAVA
jgi:hypothetical protein